jgi:SAM-dependent methyltransferase
MRGVRTQVPAWNELYRNRKGEIPRTPTSFARWAEERMPDSGLVVDLGTGTGRDGAWFARRGHEVVAADFSGAALRQTRQRLKRRGVERPDARVLALNDLRGALLLGAELAREAEPPTLYARGLVGCLDEEARSNLWRLCSMSLRRGGSLFLEYAATRHGRRGVSAPGRLVKRVSTRALVREITAAGGRVVHREVGPGHDFFDRPDPRVARLEVRWDHDTSATSRSLSPSEEHDMSSSTRLTARKELLRKAAAFPHWITDLSAAVHENRRLNRRVAELTDIVAELLVPLTDRDEEKARELLARYRESTLAP